MKSSRRLRVGMVGVGMISQFHLAGWAKNARAEVVAVCDPDVERAREKAGLHGITKVYGSLTEMLDSCAIDAIDIASPVETHAALVRTAADRGVHVKVQKPMAGSVAEAQALVDYVGERVRFMVHENYRYRPHYLTVRDWLAEGRIGELRMAHLAMRCSGMWAEPGLTPPLLQAQPYLAKFPRLLVFESMIHHLDVLRAIMGELRVISAHMFKVSPLIQGEDSAAVILNGQQGRVATLNGTYMAPGYPALPRDRLELIGDKGTMIFDVDRLYIRGQEADAIHFDMAARYQDCFTTAIERFVEGVIDGTRFESDRLDNLKTLQLVDACYQAAHR